MKRIPVFQIKRREVESFLDTLKGLYIPFSYVTSYGQSKILIFRDNNNLREIFNIKEA